MNKVFIVLSFNGLGGTITANTWVFSTRELAQAFIDSGDGDWITEGSEDRETAFAMREQIVDEKALATV